MRGKRISKIISNVIYSIGTTITLCLIAISLFGSNAVIDPDAMLPTTWRESAFFWLAIGSIPMVLACVAVYIFNGIKDTKRKKLNFFLIFLPGFVCSGCALFIIGLIGFGLVRDFLHLW